MVRGNQYLEFETHEIDWEDHPRPARRPRQDAANDFGVGWIFVLWVLASIVLLTIHVISSIGQVPAAAQQFQAGELNASQTAPAVVRPRAQDGNSSGPIPPPPYVLNLQALDGQTYRIESRTGSDIQGGLPPGLLFGFAARDLPLFDAPNGNGLLWLMPRETRFLYTDQVFSQPCWRWLITLDGQHKGYFCAQKQEQTPTAASAAPEAPARTFTYEYEGRTHEAHLSDEDPQVLPDVPFAPYGCASVPGVTETLRVGSEPPRTYQYRLCGSAIAPGVGAM